MDLRTLSSQLGLLLLLCALGAVRCEVHLVTTEGCGTTKGCIHFPTGCMSPTCDAILTWTSTDTAEYVDFEMMANAVETNGWVAFALSSDTLMTNDSVIYCFTNNSVGLAFTPLQYVEYLSAGNVLKNVSSDYVDGQIHCRFKRLKTNTGSWKIYPLGNSYYLLLGLGPLDKTGLIAKHRKDPFVSGRAVDVTEDLSDVTYASRRPAVSANTSTTTPVGVGSFEKDGNSINFYANGDYITISLVGRAGESWVAVGFSTDTKMGDDSVTACSYSLGQIIVKNWHTNGYNVESVDNPTGGLSIISKSYTANAVTCTFNRLIKGSSSKVFDLDKDYYLFLASGQSSSSGDLNKHSSSPGISSSMVNVATYRSGQIGGSSNKNINLLKAHGCLMITAWILLVSPSIILARYFKTAWPGDKICAVAIWFAVHRALMLLALACTITGFVIIFVYVGLPNPKMADFNKTYPTYFWVHGPLGIIVMILIIVNPIVSAMRCGPDSKFRPIFNWIHWLIGTCCYIIAMITIFFGAKMGEAPDDTLRISHSAIFWILIAFVAYHCVTEIALLIHKFIEEDALKRRVNIQSYELTEGGHGHAKHKAKGPEATLGGLIFRYILLSLYGIVTLGLWLAMIILIGSDNVD